MAKQAVKGAVIGAITSAVVQYAWEVGSDIVSNRSLNEDTGRSVFVPDNEEWSNIGSAALGGAVAGAITMGAQKLGGVEKTIATSRLGRAALSGAASAVGSGVSTIVDNIKHGDFFLEDVGTNMLISGATAALSAATIKPSMRFEYTENSNTWGGNNGLITDSSTVVHYSYGDPPILEAIASRVGDFSSLIINKIIGEESGE